MKLTSAEVVEYFQSVIPGLNIDHELMDRVIDSFDCPVTMVTLLNRHNDVLSGRTLLNGTTAAITPNSSITELPISRETFVSCSRSCILHMEDIFDDKLCNLNTLSFEALTELTGAYIAMGLK